MSQPPPPQYRDRSITINHDGVQITWIPTGQLVPPSTRYVDTTAQPFFSRPPSPNQAPKSPSSDSAKRMPRLTMLQQLIAWLNLSKSKSTKVLVTGASSTVRRKQTNGNLCRRSQAPKPTRTRTHRQRSHPPPSIPLPPRNSSFWSTRYACSTCKARSARGEHVQCFNYLCRGCGERAITGTRNDRGFCERCLQDVEAGVLEVGESNSWEGSCRDGDEIPRLLWTPRMGREREVLRWAREGIDAASSDSEGGTVSSISSTKAVVGYPERETRTALLRERVRSNCREKREFGELKLKKMCDNRKCGLISVNEDGDGVTIRTCSEDSLVLVSLDDEQHNRLVSMEPITFNAAQIGSPTGYAQYTWPSPRKKINQRKVVEDSIGWFSERPKLWAKSGAHLPSLLEEAINTPIFSPRMELGIKVPQNTPEEHDFSWAATSNAIAIQGRRLIHYDQISELDIPPPAYPQLYREASPTDHWMDLLDHPSTPSSRSCSPSPPSSLLVEQPLDSTFSFPRSLADSEFCGELIRTLSSQEHTEKPRDSPTLTTSSSSPGSLMFDSHYFERIQHPHPHPNRTPSPALTPYPSLSSSATSLEFGFRSTLERANMEATIHSRGCTPPPLAQSPGLEGWNNENVSLFGTTPKIGYLSNGMTVKIRSSEGKSEYDNGNGSKLLKRGAGSSGEHDNRNGSILLERGGGKQNLLVGKMKNVYDDWRGRERIKRELKVARMRPGDLKGIDLGPFIFGYAKRDKVKGKGSSGIGVVDRDRVL